MDFDGLDGTAQADLVRRKEVKPCELLEAAIRRIERVNPKLNGVVARMYELSRAAVAGNLPKGPFTGVPYLLKDLVASYCGVPMTSACAFLRDFCPDHDSELVTRLKRAGLVIVGKTNTPEVGLLPTTEPRLFGPTRNPWDMSRTPGGSSGGSAAAVASGMVPMAHGSDGGGSLRIPASCCGLFGLKPTRARNPLGPDHGDIWSGLGVEHALTRSVRDSAALLDATSGPDLGDPYWAPPRQRPFLQEVGATPGRLRIAFTTNAVIDVAIHPDCVSAVHDAVKLCAELGHEVSEAAPVIDGELQARAFDELVLSAFAGHMETMAHEVCRPLNPSEFEPLTWALYEKGRRLPAGAYPNAVQVLQKLTRQVARFFQDYDILLNPVLADPPVRLGTFDPRPNDPLYGWYHIEKFAPFTRITNITGQPAMSVPLYWNCEGLPIGTQFTARFGDEATLFRLAAQLEQARPWEERRPPVFALPGLAGPAD